MAKLLLWTMLFLAACALRSPLQRTPPKLGTHWSRHHFPIHIGIVENVHTCRAGKIEEAAQIWNTELKEHGTLFKVKTVKKIDLTKVGWIWVVEGRLQTDPEIIVGICHLGYYAGTPQLWAAKIILSRDHCNLRASVHELGHALGLRHAAQCRSCTMYKSVPMQNGILVEQGWLRPEDVKPVAAQMRLIPKAVSSD